jgi:SAM-dependent methyltransferase
MAADDAETPPSQFLWRVEADLPMRGRALDLACGRGRNSMWLASRGFTVDAVDFSAIALAKANSLAARRGVADAVRTIEHDLRTGLPPLAADAYAVVLLLHYHQPDLWPGMRAAVAPGGVMLVETLAHHPSNLDVDPAFLSERDELLAAAGDFEVVLQGQAMDGQRAVDRLFARRVR